MEELRLLGGLLKQKREEKGLSIREASEVLRLRSAIIEDLEKGEIPERTAKVYFLGYLRQYAKLLGCEREAEEVISRLKSEEKKASPGRTEEERRIGLRIPKVYLALFLLSLLSFVLYTGTPFRISPDKKPEGQKETFSLDVATGVESFEKIEKKLLISCHERTWISVIIDGKEKKEFMLNPRDVIMINAKESFDLLIGNAGGIRIFLDGQEINLSGKSGEVKRIRL